MNTLFPSSNVSKVVDPTPLPTCSPWPQRRAVVAPGSQRRITTSSAPSPVANRAVNQRGGSVCRFRRFRAQSRSQDPDASPVGREQPGRSAPGARQPTLASRRIAATTCSTCADVISGNTSGSERHLARRRFRLGKVARRVPQIGMRLPEGARESDSASPCLFAFRLKELLQPVAIPRADSVDVIGRARRPPAAGAFTPRNPAAAHRSHEHAVRRASVHPSR